ncbi:MAG: SelB C-terminal domain-containing protein [Actinomycetota bacterium]|nr:SelB C-terminal domain-containing protein [Actinomycetota bacterium]
MYVVATAGHVDHGKSALVRALTGMEPDRWQEEHRRGMTIDLGYAWTTLDSGAEVAFVDVPGHQRFIGNMLAGLGPVPAVLFVVAADEGWRQQSQEHLAAVEALGLQHGLLVVTRSDLADPAPALQSAGEHLCGSGISGCEAVAVSARTGHGLPELRSALDRLLAAVPGPDTAAPPRLWVDRSFSVRGSGTVVTGTLGQGRIAVGDRVRVLGRDADRTVTVRGLESLGRPRDEVSAVARVALNLRGVSVADVSRGDVVLGPGPWHLTSVVDVALRRVGEGPGHSEDQPGGLPGSRAPSLPSGARAPSLPSHLTAHLGTLAVEVRVRPLSPAGVETDIVRLQLGRPLPLRPRDHLILRDPGAQHVVAGAEVLDIDPPQLNRRGAAAVRAAELAALPGFPDLAHEVSRRGAMRIGEVLALGHEVSALPPETTADEEATAGSTVLRRGGWLVGPSQWRDWVDGLRSAVEEHARAEPLHPTLTVEAARAAVQVPDRQLVSRLAAEAGLEVREGRLGVRGVQAVLEAKAERGLQTLEERMEAHPYTAPEQRDLDATGLGARQLAAAEKVGRILRLPGDVVLLPTAPARAMRVLAELPQPFTTSQAREALASTRRTVIPLLEHLDARGWTRRIDGAHREVIR